MGEYALGPFFPIPGTRVPEMAIFMDKWLFLGQNTGRWSGPKYVNFWVKILILWQGGPRAVSPTCKLSDVPYHISLHGKTCIRAICALSMHPYSAGGGVK